MFKKVLSTILSALLACPTNVVLAQDNVKRASDSETDDGIVFDSNDINQAVVEDLQEKNLNTISEDRKKVSQKFLIANWYLVSYLKNKGIGTYINAQSFKSLDLVSYYSYTKPFEGCSSVNITRGDLVSKVIDAVASLQAYFTTSTQNNDNVTEGFNKVKVTTDDVIPIRVGQNSCVVVPYKMNGKIEQEDSELLNSVKAVLQNYNPVATLPFNTKNQLSVSEVDNWLMWLSHLLKYTNLISVLETGSKSGIEPLKLNQSSYEKIVQLSTVIGVNNLISQKTEFSKVFLPRFRKGTQEYSFEKCQEEKDSNNNLYCFKEGVLPTNISSKYKIYYNYNFSTGSDNRGDLRKYLEEYLKSAYLILKLEQSGLQTLVDSADKKEQVANEPKLLDASKIQEEIKNIQNASILQSNVRKFIDANKDNEKFTKIKASSILGKQIKELMNQVSSNTELKYEDLFKDNRFEKLFEKLFEENLEVLFPMFLNQKVFEQIDFVSNCDQTDPQFIKCHIESVGGTPEENKNFFKDLVSSVLKDVIRKTISDVIAQTMVGNSKEDYQPKSSQLFSITFDSNLATAISELVDSNNNDFNTYNEYIKGSEDTQEREEKIKTLASSLEDSKYYDAFSYWDSILNRMQDITNKNDSDKKKSIAKKEEIKSKYEGEFPYDYLPWFFFYSLDKKTSGYSYIKENIGDKPLFSDPNDTESTGTGYSILQSGLSSLFGSYLFSTKLLRKRSQLVNDKEKELNFSDYLKQQINISDIKFENDSNQKVSKEAVLLSAIYTKVTSLLAGSYDSYLSSIKSQQLLKDVRSTLDSRNLKSAYIDSQNPNMYKDNVVNFDQLIKQLTKQQPGSLSELDSLSDEELIVKMKFLVNKYLYTDLNKEVTADLIKQKLKLFYNAETLINYLSFNTDIDPLGFIKRPESLAQMYNIKSKVELFENLISLYKSSSLNKATISSVFSEKIVNSSEALKNSIGMDLSDEDASSINSLVKNLLNDMNLESSSLDDESVLVKLYDQFTKRAFGKNSQLSAIYPSDRTLKKFIDKYINKDVSIEILNKVLKRVESLLDVNSIIQTYLDQKELVEQYEKDQGLNSVAEKDAFEKIALNEGKLTNTYAAFLVRLNWAINKEGIAPTSQSDVIDRNISYLLKYLVSYFDIKLNDINGWKSLLEDSLPSDWKAMAQTALEIYTPKNLRMLATPVSKTLNASSNVEFPFPFLDEEEFYNLIPNENVSKSDWIKDTQDPDKISKYTMLQPKKILEGDSIKVPVAQKMHVYSQWKLSPIDKKDPMLKTIEANPEVVSKINDYRNILASFRDEISKFYTDGYNGWYLKSRRSQIQELVNKFEKDLQKIDSSVSSNIKISSSNLKDNMAEAVWEFSHKVYGLMEKEVGSKTKLNEILKQLGDIGRRSAFRNIYKETIDIISSNVDSNLSLIRELATKLEDIVTDKDYEENEEFKELLKNSTLSLWDNVRQSIESLGIETPIVNEKGQTIWKVLEQEKQQDQKRRSFWIDLGVMGLAAGLQVLASKLDPTGTSGKASWAYVALIGSRIANCTFGVLLGYDFVTSIKDTYTDSSLKEYDEIEKSIYVVITSNDSLISDRTALVLQNTSKQARSSLVSNRTSPWLIGFRAWEALFTFQILAPALKTIVIDTAWFKLMSSRIPGQGLVDKKILGEGIDLATKISKNQTDNILDALQKGLGKNAVYTRNGSFYFIGKDGKKGIDMLKGYVDKKTSTGIRWIGRRGVATAEDELMYQGIRANLDKGFITQEQIKFLFPTDNAFEIMHNWLMDIALPVVSKAAPSYRYIKGVSKAAGSDNVIRQFYLYNEARKLSKNIRDQRWKKYGDFIDASGDNANEIKKKFNELAELGGFTNEELPSLFNALNESKIKRVLSLDWYNRGIHNKIASKKLKDSVKSAQDIKTRTVTVNNSAGDNSLYLNVEDPANLSGILKDMYSVDGGVPSNFVWRDCFAEALEKVETTLNSDLRSFIVILGEAGTGKSTLVRALPYIITDFKEQTGFLFKELSADLLADARHGGTAKLVESLAQEAQRAKAEGKRLVLWTDEFHTIAYLEKALQGHEHATDNTLTSMLKKLLEDPNSNLSLIASTTKYDLDASKLMADEAFKTRVSAVVELPSLSQEEMDSFVKGMLDYYELASGIKVLNFETKTFAGKSTRYLMAGTNNGIARYTTKLGDKVGPVSLFFKHSMGLEGDIRSQSTKKVVEAYQKMLKARVQFYKTHITPRKTAHTEAVLEAISTNQIPPQLENFAEDPEIIEGIQKIMKDFKDDLRRIVGGDEEKTVELLTRMDFEIDPSTKLPTEVRMNYADDNSFIAKGIKDYEDAQRILTPSSDSSSRPSSMDDLLRSFGEPQSEVEPAVPTTPTTPATEPVEPDFSVNKTIDPDSKIYFSVGGSN